MMEIYRKVTNTLLSSIDVDAMNRPPQLVTRGVRERMVKPAALLVAGFFVHLQGHVPLQDTERR